MRRHDRASAHARERLLPLMDRRQLGTGCRVHGPDAPSDRFYLIESGSVRFTALHDATTAEPTVLRSMPHETLRAEIAAEPSLAEWLLERLATKLSYAYAMLEMGRARSPAEIIVQYAKWMSGNGLAIRRGDGIVSLPMTQEALAGRLGLSRSSIAAALAELRDAGHADTQYGSVSVRIDHASGS